MEGIEDHAANPRAQRHAETRYHGGGAKHRSHDPRAEIFAREHGVERHHAAIGGPEHDRKRVERAQFANVEIAPDRERLHQQAADQNPLRTQPIGEEAEQEASAQAGQAFHAVDADRGHCRDAAEHGVADHVEDRPGMRGAAREKGQRQHQELRRAQRAADGPSGSGIAGSALCGRT